MEKLLMPLMSKLQVTIVKLFVYSLITVIIGSSTAKAGYIYTTIRDPDPSVDNTRAFGINNAGQIVGWSRMSNTTAAYVYNGGVFSKLNTPFAGSMANGINNTGQIVGFYVDPPTITAGNVFVKNGVNYTTLDVPGATYTDANGINDVGDVAGYYHDYHDVGGVSTFGHHGFVKSAGGYRTIDVPGATYTWAYGINNSGQVAGTFFDGTKYNGFIEDGGVFTILDHYGSGTFVFGINNLGDVVGYYTSDQNRYHGFVRSGGIYTKIQPPDGYDGAFAQAWGINDLGQIVGYYNSASNPNEFQGFLATPDGFNAVVPEPSMSVVASALLGLGYVWRRRKIRQVATTSEQDNPM